MFPILTFTASSQLSVGNLYHLVATNVDANPRANWLVLNTQAVATSVSNPSWVTRWFDSLDWSVIVQKDGVWIDYVPWYQSAGVPAQSLAPIMDLGWTDSVHTGSSNLATKPALPLSTTAMTRELFAPAAQHVATGAAFRVASPGGATLRWRLVGPSGVLESGDITISAGAQRWIDVAFRSPRSLTLGSSYSLEMQAVQGLAEMIPMYAGDSNGFSGGSLFVESVAQSSSNGGSSWGRVDGTSYHFPVVLYVNERC
jgi:hypothetical protein